MSEQITNETLIWQRRDTMVLKNAEEEPWHSQRGEIGLSALGEKRGLAILREGVLHLRREDGGDSQDSAELGD